MKKILITGCNGYIGKSLFQKLKDEFDITRISRSDFDLSNSSETINFFSKNYFDVVLHCAVSGGNRLKEDSSDVLDNNLKMYYNLLNCRDRYNRLINFGSGAEIYNSDSPYGLSKNVISKSILEKENFFNIRIFGLFDENELDTRFIKSNIIRYIKKEPLFVFNDKEMDFFYMEDFTRLIKHFIFNDTENLPKIYECTYNKTFRTVEIVNMINSLSDYTLPIIINGYESNPYVGTYFNLNIEYVGLEKGIKNTYNIIKKNYD